MPRRYRPQPWRSRSRRTVIRSCKCTAPSPASEIRRIYLGKDQGFVTLFLVQAKERAKEMLRHPSLRRRIVLPFILLVLLIGVVGVAVVSAQVGGSVEGAADNSLIQNSLRTNDRLATLENDRLQQLRAAHDEARSSTVTSPRGR